jgi:hypothetical protein
LLRGAVQIQRPQNIVEVFHGSSERAPAVSPDGRLVVFMLSIRGREVEGAIARDALEEHFWLPHDADARRTLRTFENGRNRIVAVAQRKLLARPDEPLRLTINDFMTR